MNEPRCIHCQKAATFNAASRSDTTQAALPICSELCLVQHIEAKRRNRAAQDRAQDIDPVDTPSVGSDDDVDLSVKLMTRAGRTVRPLGPPDPSVANTPGMVQVRRKFKPPSGAEDSEDDDYAEPDQDQEPRIPQTRRTPKKVSGADLSDDSDSDAYPDDDDANDDPSGAITLDSDDNASFAAYPDQAGYDSPSQPMDAESDDLDRGMQEDLEPAAAEGRAGTGGGGGIRRRKVIDLTGDDEPDFDNSDAQPAFAVIDLTGDDDGGGAARVPAADPAKKTDVIDLTGDDEPDFDNSDAQPAFAVIAPADPDDMPPRRPRWQAGQVIDLTVDDGQELPADEPLPKITNDPAADGGLVLESQLAVETEQENNYRDEDPPALFDAGRVDPVPPLANEQTKEESEAFRKNSFPRPDVEEAGGFRLQYARYAQDNDLIVERRRVLVKFCREINNQLAMHLSQSELLAQALSPVALWFLESERNDVKTTNMLWIINTPPGVNGTTWRTSQEAVDLLKAIETELTVATQTAAWSDNVLMRVLTLTDGWETIQAAATELQNLAVGTPKNRQFTVSDLANYVERDLLEFDYELTPSVPDARLANTVYGATTEFYSLRDDIMRPWRVWNNYEFISRMQKDNYPWHPSLSTKWKDTPVDADATFRASRDYRKDGTIMPHTKMVHQLVAAMVRGFNRGSLNFKRQLFALVGKSLDQTAMQWVYGPSPVHLFEMFRATKQFYPSVNGQRARDLRQAFQNSILNDAQVDLNAAGCKTAASDAFYSPAAYVPNLGGLLWHGTRSAKLVSGEFVIRDGTFFSADSEMAARYSAANRVDEQDPRPALICYKIERPLPRTMVHFRWIPIDTKKSPDHPTADAPLDLYFTGRALDLPFWKHFGVLPGFFTPQAEVVAKVWGTGMVVHMAQSVGAVLERAKSARTERQFNKGSGAIADSTSFCRAGIEVMLANPRRYVKRLLRPSIDDLVTLLALARPSMGVPDAEEISLRGIAYGYADLLSAMYYSLLQAVNVPEDVQELAPPYAVARLREYNNSQRLLSAETLVRDQTSSTFIEYTFTYTKRDDGEISNSAGGAAGMRDTFEQLPWLGRFVYAPKVSCVVASGEPFRSKMIASVLDLEDSSLNFIPAWRADFLFRRYLLACRAQWPMTIFVGLVNHLKAENLEALGVEASVIDQLTAADPADILAAILSEGYRYDPSADLSAILLPKQSDNEFVPDTRTHLLFSYRDYLYMIQESAYTRTGAGRRGVLFNEADRESKDYDSPLAFGFFHNDRWSSGARRQNVRGPDVPAGQ